VLKKLLLQSRGRVLTYGWGVGADYRLDEFHPGPRGGEFVFRTPAGERVKLTPAAYGRHNCENALAVAILMHEIGLDWETINRGLGAFSGVRRRQEVVGRCGDSIYMSDFAHHPTAIARTLEALREHFPDHRLLAVFEPRTATSRRNLFQEELGRAFTAADEVYLAPVHGAAVLNPAERLDTGRLAEAVAACGRPARAWAEIGELGSALRDRAGARELVVLMSTGDFGGLFRQLAGEVWE
jgi:UDP-N-acetylmuramate: L-alanyl-gamma-D-glutamyl-meso-diaminopimelate ligase